MDRVQEVFISSSSRRKRLEKVVTRVGCETGIHKFIKVKKSYVSRSIGFRESVKSGNEDN